MEEPKKVPILGSCIYYLRRASRSTCRIDHCVDEIADLDERIKPLIEKIHLKLLPLHGDEAWLTAQEFRHLANKKIEINPLIELTDKVQTRSQTNRNEILERSTAQVATWSDQYSIRPVHVVDKRRWILHEFNTSYTVSLRSGRSSTKKADNSRRKSNFTAEGECSHDLSTAVLGGQPETRPISRYLFAELKGMYAALGIVQSKYIEADKAWTTPNGTNSNNEQWQALIALHRTLLHEHHDFFLASQYLSVNDILKRLPLKFTMLAKLWGHGAHSFLKLLRHCLPSSLEQMRTFIYMSYSMIALPYGTVSSFGETWIEYLGDLRYYKIAIEDDHTRGREVWTSVPHHWYSKASNKSPISGRLDCHFTIITRLNSHLLLFYYTCPLFVPIHFAFASESIMMLFEQTMDSDPGIFRIVPSGVAFRKSREGFLVENTNANWGSGDDFLGEVGARRRIIRWWAGSSNRVIISNSCNFLELEMYDLVGRMLTTSYRHFRKILRHTWHPLLIALLHLPRVCADDSPGLPNHVINSVEGNPGIRTFWYLYLVLSTLATETLAFRSNDYWSFHGFAMGMASVVNTVSTLEDAIPLDIFVSSAFAGTWNIWRFVANDLERSRWNAEQRQIFATLQVFVGGGIDLLWSTWLAHNMSPLPGSQDPRSVAQLMVRLILPSMAISVFICTSLRTLSKILLSSRTNTDDIEVVE